MSNLTPRGWPYMDPSDSARTIAPSVKDMILAADADVTELETNFLDTGWLTTGVVAAAAGFTLLGQVARLIGNRAYLRIVYTTNSVIANGPSGDIGNKTVATIIDSRFQPAVQWPLASYSSGRLASHSIAGASINLNALGGTSDLAVNDALSAGGDYLVD